MNPVIVGELVRERVGGHLAAAAVRREALLARCGRSPRPGRRCPQPF